MASPVSNPYGTTIGTKMSSDMTAKRYRCNACGNLTRFDVTATRKTRSYHHYSVGGELEIPEEVVIEETINEVTCRWCGHGNGVEEIEVTD